MADWIGGRSSSDADCFRWSKVYLSASLARSQLACLLPAGILNSFRFNALFATDIANLGLPVVV